MEITINAELITTFHTHSEWVNKASTTIGGFNRSEQILCIDKNGDCLTIGHDFTIAKEKDLFPVKAYRLIRTSEQIIKKAVNQEIAQVNTFPQGFTINMVEHPVLNEGMAIMYLSSLDYKKMSNKKSVIKLESFRERYPNDGNCELDALCDGCNHIHKIGDRLIKELKNESVFICPKCEYKLYTAIK